MKIILDSFPQNAHDMIRIHTKNNKQDLYFSTSEQIIGIAQIFGFSMASVQSPGHGYESDYYRPTCFHGKINQSNPCECGTTFTDILEAAKKWLSENDGAIADDPGYFKK